MAGKGTVEVAKLRRSPLCIYQQWKALEWPGAPWLQGLEAYKYGLPVHCRELSQVNPSVQNPYCPANTTQMMPLPDERVANNDLQQSRRVDVYLIELMVLRQSNAIRAAMYLNQPEHRSSESYHPISRVIELRSITTDRSSHLSGYEPANGVATRHSYQWFE